MEERNMKECKKNIPEINGLADDVITPLPVMVYESMNDWVNWRDDKVDGVDWSSLFSDDVLKTQHFFLKCHYELFAVLGRPAAQLRMLGDEVIFLLELVTDDVLNTAVVQCSLDDYQICQFIGDHWRWPSSAVSK